ncbi:MAG: hypothetical protein JRN68_01670 [Nitrososphaerota archaeon]|jgi:hypothetical protein|nr:hypothetical protein [Nitrososphaerota archaeon]
MPRKRAAYGSFTNGERMCGIFLKVAGWKSEYKSVQRLMNHLARRIRSEGSRDCCLSWLYRYCRNVGKDPTFYIGIDAYEEIQDSIRRDDSYE